MILTNDINVFGLSNKTYPMSSSTLFDPPPPRPLSETCANMRIKNSAFPLFEFGTTVFSTAGTGNKMSLRIIVRPLLHVALKNNSSNNSL